MDQATNLAIVALYIALLLTLGAGVSLWQERKYGRKDDSPEE